MNQYVLFFGSIIMFVSSLLEPIPLLPQMSDSFLLLWIGLAVAAEQRGDV